MNRVIVKEEQRAKLGIVLPNGDKVSVEDWKRDYNIGELKVEDIKYKKYITENDLQVFKGNKFNYTILLPGKCRLFVSEEIELEGCRDWGGYLFLVNGVYKGSSFFCLWRKEQWFSTISSLKTDLSIEIVELINDWYMRY